MSAAPFEHHAEIRISDGYGPPDMRRIAERDLVARLAADAQEHGWEFVRWPVITETYDKHTFSTELKATVWLIPR